MARPSGSALTTPVQAARVQESMQPTADYLRAVVRSVISSADAPPELTVECERLMRLINANDLDGIPDSLAALQRTAEATGFSLPAADWPASRSRTQQ